jgi:hypothetical protein
MEGNAMTKTTIFISYSHNDEDCKKRRVTHQRVLQQDELQDKEKLRIFPVIINPCAIRSRMQFFKTCLPQLSMIQKFQSIHME